MKRYRDNVAGICVRLINNKLSDIILVLITALSLTSCIHKELCYNHNHFTKVKIAFNWKDYDTEYMPNGMRVVFFPVDGGESWVFDMAGCDGAIVQLPQNSYNIICYNNDTDGLIFKSEYNYSDYCSTTESILTPDSKHAVKTADFLCGASKEGVCLQDLPVGSETVITLYPKRMVCRYRYVVKGIKKLSNIIDIRASLNGMSSSVLLAADYLPQGDSNCLLFGGSVRDDKISSSFYTFGYNSQPNTFTLYIKAKDGKMHQLECDVTEQILKVERKGHIADVDLLIEFDYSVPGGEGGSGAGFDVDVSDWDDVNQDIYI